MRFLPLSVGFGLLGVTAVIACGTHLSAIDSQAVTLQIANCADGLEQLADAGPRFSQARGDDFACLCGARGIAKRGGLTVPDAGAGCPQ